MAHEVKPIKTKWKFEHHTFIERTNFIPDKFPIRSYRSSCHMLKTSESILADMIIRRSASRRSAWRPMPRTIGGTQ